MKMSKATLVPALIGLLLSVLLVWPHTVMADINDGLIAYYPFNGSANDETGNGHDGAVDGATLSTDRFDNPLSAYSFDGVNDKILIGQAPDNFPNLDAYAVSVWFLNNGGGDQRQGYGQKILSKGDFFTDFHLSVGPDGDPAGYLSWWSDQGGFASVTDTSKDYRDNVWHHVVLNKKTASAGDLWVDGVLQASSNSLAKVDNSVDLVIGFTAHTDGFQQKYWSGKIDDIRIYNRVLSEAEISALFTEGEPPPDQDGDGIPDSEDACPDTDLNPIVLIDGCASEVANPLFPTGCTLSDLIMQCADGIHHHGGFVRCVAHLTKDLKQVGIITGQQKSAIRSCAAQADIPGARQRSR